MKKILFILLVVGIACSGIESASAVKLTPLEERNVNITPRTPTKVRKPKMMPNGPMKPVHHGFGLAKVRNNPDEYVMQGNTLWKKIPIPKSSCGSRSQR